MQKAVDTQFSRVDHMMFTNTIITNEEGDIQKDEDTGAIVTEDDGC